MEFDFQKITDEIALISLKGDLVYTEVGAIRNEINRCLKEITTKIIMDLSQIHKIDSAGLGMLVGTLARCRESGDMVLLKPADEVKRAMRMTKIDTLLQSTESIVDAISHFKTIKNPIKSR